MGDGLGWEVIAHPPTIEPGEKNAAITVALCAKCNADSDMRAGMGGWGFWGVRECAERKGG